MSVRNPEAKREMILQGALEEFAEFGLAGARLGRLAKRAGVSAGLVYSFHESKEALFDAVYDSIVTRVVGDIRLDPANLPDYAGRLIDGIEEYPLIARFLGWYRLQGGQQGGGQVAADATAAKIAEIRAAQDDGRLPATDDPARILAVTVGVANMWQVMGDDLLQHMDRADRRAATVDVVARYLG
jgi:AcrR family transcriptional regulator